MKTVLSIFFLFIAIFFSCSQTPVPDNEKHVIKDSIILLSDNYIDTIVIKIQPYNDFPEKLTNNLFEQLKKLYPYVEINQSILLPKQAYYAPRNRYKADTLIWHLSKNSKRSVNTIGLTSKDISTTKGNISDWGIMGLGYMPGNACVISTFRLNKKNIQEQFYKVAIHELGHTQGLDHCPDKSCFMRDAEGKNHTNEEKYFCPKCKAVLVQKGWKFDD